MPVSMLSRKPDYRGKTYVQPDGSVPKKGLTPPFAKKKDEPKGAAKLAFRKRG